MIFRYVFVSDLFNQRELPAEGSVTALPRTG